MDAMDNAMVAILNEILVEGCLVVFVCFAVGQIIKSSTIPFLDKIDNGNIPIITALLGMALSFIPAIFPNDPIPVAMIKGVITGWGSVGIAETIKNFKCKNDE